MYSWAPLTREVDLSDVINEQIKSAGGEGIINLSASSKSCGINYAPVFSLMPFWPGCADVTVSGQIVRRRAGRRSDAQDFIPPQRTRAALEAALEMARR